MKSHQQHLTGEGETVCGFIKAAEVSSFMTFLSYQADSCVYPRSPLHFCKNRVGQKPRVCGTGGNGWKTTANKPLPEWMC